MTRKKRIVLVEDEPTLANLIEAGLQEQGYKVQSAQDGKKGLKLILEAKPDLALLDVMLPGLKGFDILEKLIAKHVLPALPVIIISNSGDPVEIERALKMGVKDYLVKVNFNPNEVIEKVNAVMENDEEGHGRKAAKGKTMPVKGNRVLLVEDENILADTLEQKLIEKKYQVLKAPNAAAARKMLAENAIDVILLDLVLPDEHGLGFLRELKRDGRAARIPVIIISNLGQQEEIAEGLKSGAVDYIVKTNTVPEEIAERIDTIARKGHST